MWSELGRSSPFRPMSALMLQWSWAFSLVCEVALSWTWTLISNLGPLHPRAKSRDLVMVRTLDSHPKAIPPVLGKVVLCSVWLSRIIWSENGPCCGTIAYFVGGEKGRIWFDIICLKLYQFERITWWCLYNLESILKYVMKFALQFSPWNSFYWKIYQKVHDPPRGGLDENSGRAWNLTDSPPCRTPCKLFIHEVFFRPLDLHLHMNLGGLHPFDQWELLDCNGRGPSVLYVKWPLISFRDYL
jgi:hypothetical protein